jgi:predicted permease
VDELRLAFRRLSHSPGASIASILTLACSIGAAAAMWSLLSAVLLRPLPIHDADRVFVVGQSRAVRGMSSVAETHTYPLYQQVRERGAFGHVAAGGAGAGRLLVETAGVPVRTEVYFATHDWFELLGVPIRIGRAFTPVEDQRGAAPVAILSDSYWRRAFTADRQIVGRALTIAGRKVTIVGVAPPGFRGLDLTVAPDIYLPFHTVADVSSATMNFFDDGTRRNAPTAWVTILGRLRSESGVAETLQRLSALEQPIGGRPGLGYVLVPVSTAALPATARAGIGQFTRLLASTVGLLLLIGCTTVGMLLLVRAEARREEFATCLALGASRIRLARGVALEGLVVSCAGTLLSLPVAHWLFALVRSFQLPGRVPLELLSLSIDWRVGLASIAAAFTATLVIGSLAGMFGFSGEIAEALRARTGATPRVTRRRIRTFLVAAQVAVALVLLAGAGLLIRSLSAALNLNPGFETDRLVIGGVSLGPYGYTPLRSAAFASDLTDRLRGNPALRSFGLTESKGGMTESGRLTVDGQPRQFPSMVSFIAADDRYFSTMGLPVTAGRDFSPADTASAPLVIIVSESFGRMIANGGNPIGSRITSWVRRPPAPPPILEIVGVVPDVITRVTISEPLVLYVPMAQADRSANVEWVARSAGPAKAAIREIMSAIKQLDPAVTPSPMLTLRERLGQQMSPQWFGATVLGALGVIAVLLTALGTYVLAETMATVRLREMGIRAALGASRRQLAGLMLAETARLVGSGLVVGFGLAWLGASTIRAFLFRVQPLDPATLSGVALVILALAFAVSLQPALRIAGVDVARVLKE